MAYCQLEDLHGLVEVIIFPDLFRAAEPLIVPENIVRVTGTVDRQDKGAKIKGAKMESLTDLQMRAVARVNLRLHGAREGVPPLDRLRQVLQRHPGPTPLSMTLCLPPDLEADTAPLPNVTVLPSEQFVAEVEEVLGRGAVALM